MKKRIFSLLLVVVFVFGSLTGCGKNTDQTDKEQKGTGKIETEEFNTGNQESDSKKEHVTIRLADQSIAMILYFHYAEEKGILKEYFKDYDVNFELYDFASGPAVNEAIAAGQLDFSVEGNLPSVTGPISGYGTEVIATLAISSSSVGAVVTPTNSSVNSLQDTIGKTVGTAIGTAYHYNLARFYEAAGISIDDVNLVNVGANVATALRSGEIDAGYVTLANAQVLESEGSTRTISEDLIVTAPVHYFIASKNFAEKYPELTVTLLKAIKATEKVILEDQEAFKAYYDKFLGSDASTYVKSLFSWELNVKPVDDQAVDEIEKILVWLDKNGLADTTGKSAKDVYDNKYYELAGFTD